jgi:hypothetical protein
MHKNATKCNKTLSKWWKNKHGASKIIDTFESYHCPYDLLPPRHVKRGNFRKGGRHKYRSQSPQLAWEERRWDLEKKKNILLICDPLPLDHPFHHLFHLVYEREHHTCRIGVDTLFNLMCIWIWSTLLWLATVISRWNPFTLWLFHCVFPLSYASNSS